jgi:hypothetical protein
MGAILLIVLIVGLCVFLFRKKDNGKKLKCDHCGFQFDLNESNYQQFTMNGKICPMCKKCINK